MAGLTQLIKTGRGVSSLRATILAARWQQRFETLINPRGRLYRPLAGGGSRIGIEQSSFPVKASERFLPLFISHVRGNDRYHTGVGILQLPVRED